MRVKRSAWVTALIVLAATNLLSQQTVAPSGPFLGQKPPGTTPEVFAPGIVSKEGDQGRLFIAPDGSEIIYWERDVSGRMRIISIFNKGGVWSGPEALPFSEEYINNEPCLSPDKAPTAGSAHVWYLGHCAYAVRTSDHLLIFDYQEKRDGQRSKSRPARPSLAEGWIDPAEIKDLKVRVFVSHSHDDHYDPVILTWKEAIPDIAYHFGWKAADEPSYHYLVGPRAEIKAGGLEIATINSHHSGVPEVAWLVKVDGLVIYHNGDCQPGDPSAEHDFLRTKTDAIDLAFVFPVTAPGQKYTIQEEDFFRKFRVRAAFPMHVQAGDSMHLDFQKAFQAKFPGLAIFVPSAMGQKWAFAKGAADEGAIKAPVPRTQKM